MPNTRATDAPPSPQLGRVPAHVAIIMDGNGRWARARGLPRAAGHRAGTENLRRVLPAVVRYGIKYLTVYAFSTENWDRPRPEVDLLLGLIERVIEAELSELNAQGVRLKHLGFPDRLEPRLIAKIASAEETTRHNERLILNVAFNYGGRAEIVHAVREIVRAGLDPNAIDEDTIARHLLTSGQPDPDLIIRTGGDVRTSNFLVWQAAYSELYSTPVFWPDFDEEELLKALVTYQHRERRFGRIVE